MFRIDVYSLAVGIIVALGIFIVAALAVDWRGLGGVCLGGEDAVLCAREWADVLAIIGGIAAVILVSIQIRQAQNAHREEMVFATLKVRALVQRTLKRRRELIRKSNAELAKLVDATRGGDEKRDDEFGVQLWLLEKYTGQDDWSKIQELDDGSLEHSRSRARIAISRCLQQILIGEFSNQASMEEAMGQHDNPMIVTIGESKLLFRGRAVDQMTIDFVRMVTENVVDLLGDVDRFYAEMINIGAGSKRLTS